MSEFIVAPSGSNFDLLAELDQKIFPDDGAFGYEDFIPYSCFLIYIDGEIAGSIVFAENKTFAKTHSDPDIDRHGTLYIISTGLLENYRGFGIGNRIKEWQINYARTRGFKNIVTNCRKSNQRIISLNLKFGFICKEALPEYYGDGEEGLAMEKTLN